MIVKQSLGRGMPSDRGEPVNMRVFVCSRVGLAVARLPGIATYTHVTRNIYYCIAR